MTLKWLPNVLTLARCALAFGVGTLILTQPRDAIWPLLAFILVAATDFLDGWTARKLNAVSAFGAFLDPIADKLLVGVSLIALAVLESGAWLIIIPTLAIISRDIFATVLRLFPKIEMPVSRLAKWKTALEMVGISILLLAGATTSQLLWDIGLGVVWVAAALSVYTLGLYVGALAADVKRPR